MSLARLIRGFAAVLLLCSFPPGASGQEEKQGAESDSTETRFLKPVWSVRTSSDQMSTELGSRMNVNINPGMGWLINSSIDVGKKKYKTREMTDIQEGFSLTGAKQEKGVYFLSLGVSDNYRSTQSVSIARFGKDIVNEDKKVSASFNYLQPLLFSESSNIRVYGDYNEGQHDFKYDEKFTLEANSNLSYSVGDHITVSGGYGKFAASENSRVGYLHYESMPTSIDTVTFNSGYRKNQDEYIVVSYQKTEGEINRVEPPRGNALQVIDNPELAKRDIIEIERENFNISSAYLPFDDVVVEVKFDHTMDDNQYLVNERLSKRQETDNLSAETSYRFSEKGRATVSLSKRKTDIDYGPTSVSAYKENQDKVSMRASQELGDNMKISVNGQTYLKQRFYKKYEENPRDVDNLYYGGGASLDAEPFQGVETSVDVEGSRYEFINIDASLSSDNRTRYLYRLSPMIIIRPYDWLDLSQNYEVKIEYTEYTFDENRNYIDRTTRVETEAKVRFPGKHTSFGFNHRYNMRDTGSYLTFEGEKKYNRTSEDFRHEFRLNLSYKPYPFVTFSTDNTLRFRKNNTLGVSGGERVVVNSNTYESGTFRIGARGKKDVVLGASLNLDVAYIRNFGSRITREMKEYVRARMSLSYEF